MHVFSVAQFVDFVNSSFSAAVFPEGAVIEGEVVEYRVSQDKWIWFQLKDEQAIVACFATVWQLRIPLEDGMRIRAFGMPKIHAKSGKFSVTVDRVELVGEGALRRAFELLKTRLAAEGLFAPERKRPIPRFPERIGLIASGDSAAYSDFLRILKNRWGGVEVRHVDVSVQGRDAVRDIVAAFARFNAEPSLADVIVLTRGGGSLEDLHAFNSEEVARAVFGSRIPVVVGVGHERDESLADYVADVRASTPSNAAEIVAPERREIASLVENGARRMDAAMRSAVDERMRGVDSFVTRLETRITSGVSDFRHRLKDLAAHFRGYLAALDGRGRALHAVEARLAANAGFWTAALSSRLDAHARLLKSLDPRRPLERGYALITANGTVLKDAASVDVGDAIRVQLARGRIDAAVTATAPSEERTA